MVKPDWFQEGWHMMQNSCSAVTSKCMLIATVRMKFLLDLNCYYENNNAYKHLKGHKKATRNTDEWRHHLIQKVQMRVQCLLGEKKTTRQR